MPSLSCEAPVKVHASCGLWENLTSLVKEITEGPARFTQKFASFPAHEISRVLPPSVRSVKSSNVHGRRAGVWSLGKQSPDCIDELVILGTSDNPALVFLVTACIACGGWAALGLQNSLITCPGGQHRVMIGIVINWCCAKPGLLEGRCTGNRMTLCCSPGNSFRRCGASSASVLKGIQSFNLLILALGWVTDPFFPNTPWDVLVSKIYHIKQTVSEQACVWKPDRNAFWQVVCFFIFLVFAFPRQDLSVYRWLSWNSL